MNFLQNIKNYVTGAQRSFRVGSDWEKDTKKIIFPSNGYDLLHETPTFKQNNNRFIESSLNPDFKFRDKKTKKEFWVECKFRSSLMNGKIEWSKPKQFERYKTLCLKEPVFVCLAFDHKINNDELYYLIPLTKINYTGLYPSFIKNFEIGLSPMVSNVLWKL